MSIKLFSSQINSLYLLLGGLTAAFPLLDFLTEVGPTYPTRAIVVGVTSLVAIVVFVLGYVSLLPKRIGIVKRWLWGSAVALFVGFVGYMICYEYLTVEAPGNYRIAKGVEYTERAKKYLSIFPESSDKELLEAIEYKPDQVWTPGSLGVGRALVGGSWLFFFGMFQLFIVAVGVLDAKREKTESTKTKNKAKKESAPGDNQ
jgi:hypothetical protein